MVLLIILKDPLCGFAVWMGGFLHILGEQHPLQADKTNDSDTGHHIVQRSWAFRVRGANLSRCCGARDGYRPARSSGSEPVRPRDWAQELGRMQSSMLMGPRSQCREKKARSDRRAPLQIELCLPKRCWNPKPINGALFGNRVFFPCPPLLYWDIIDMSFSYLCCGHVFCYWVN